MGKRKRSRQKEAEKRAKRQKTNPRKRNRSGRSRKEGIDRSKLMQAAKRSVQTTLPLGKLARSMKVNEEVIFGLEALRSKNITVVPWDGV